MSARRTPSLAEAGIDKSCGNEQLMTCAQNRRSQIPLDPRAHHNRVPGHGGAIEDNDAACTA